MKTRRSGVVCFLARSCQADGRRWLEELAVCLSAFRLRPPRCQGEHGVIAEPGTCWKARKRLYCVGGHVSSQREIQIGLLEYPSRLNSDFKVSEAAG